MTGADGAGAKAAAALIKRAERRSFIVNFYSVLEKRCWMDTLRTSRHGDTLQPIHSYVCTGMFW